MDGQLNRHFKKILKNTLKDLAQPSADRNAIRIEQQAEPIDQIQSAGQRELSVMALEREARLRREVEAALERITDGSFGICLQCEEEIPLRRLEVLPWARHCVQCQEAMDRRSKQELGGTVLLSTFLAA